MVETNTDYSTTHRAAAVNTPTTDTANNHQFIPLPNPFQPGPNNLIPLKQGRLQGGMAIGVPAP